MTQNMLKCYKVSQSRYSFNDSTTEQNSFKESDIRSKTGTPAGHTDVPHRNWVSTQGLKTGRTLQQPQTLLLSLTSYFNKGGTTYSIDA